MFEKKRGTRFLASVMALVMLLSLAPVGALAADGETLTNEECSTVPLPANEVNPKPVVTDEENTANTNEELTPPPPNEDYAETPADNNDASTAISETLVILNPVDLLNQASDYTTELTWFQPQPSTTQEATFFYLKTPTSKLNSNKAKDWGPALGNGEINTDGLKWKKSDVWGSNGRVENATNVTNSNVNSWPSTHGKYDSEKDGYVLSKESTHWKTIFNAYKDSIKEQLSMENLQESDVEAIILTPFKVSKHNITTGETEKSYHVDCKVEVKCHTFATATFKLWDDEAKEYQDHSADNYQVGSLVTFPKMPDKSGYTFSGWYLDEGRTQPVGDSYTINNNVTFYAKYEKEQPPTPKTYTLTIKYVYEDGSEAATTHTEQLKKDAEYSVTSPVISGYTADEVTVAGTMPAENKEVTVTYKENTYTLTIKYVYENGSEAATTHTEQLKKDAEYSVTSPVISGYTADEVTVAGTMPAENKEVTVTYKENTYTLTIKYVYENGSEAATTHTEQLKKDAEYSVTSPVISGYTADEVTVAGTMPAENKEVTVTYKENTYTLTIKYVYENGSEAATTHTEQLKKDAEYSVTSPVISGYTADEVTVAGTMPAENREVTVTYYLDNWKDAGEAGKDSENGGDGIPDCDQVLIKYVSSNSDRGTVSPDMEVLTIRRANEKVVPTANGSTATDYGGRNYFSNWTKDNTQVSTNATLNNETIQKVIKEFTGGKTYTFTANFGYSSGGGSGGSNRPKPPVVEIPDDVPTGLNGKDHYAYIIGYGNNDVRPQNNITRAEVATIFFRLLTDETREANMTKSNGYNDVKDGDWFCCAVSTLSKMGIIKGYEDGSFKPDQKITRAETMTLVNRVLNRLPETKDDLHKDMKTWVDNMDETAWYYLAVQEATNSHYFKNKTGTKFEQWTDLRDTRDWSELEK